MHIVTECISPFLSLHPFWFFTHNLFYYYLYLLWSLLVTPPPPPPPPPSHIFFLRPIPSSLSLLPCVFYSHMCFLFKILNELNCDIYLLHSSLHCGFWYFSCFNYITFLCLYLFLTPNSRSVFCAGVSLNIHSFIHSFIHSQMFSERLVDHGCRILGWCNVDVHIVQVTFSVAKLMQYKPWIDICSLWKSAKMLHGNFLCDLCDLVNVLFTVSTISPFEITVYFKHNHWLDV